MTHTERDVLRRCGLDTRPGFYYVSAAKHDGSAVYARAMMRGPYATHAAALAAVDTARADADRIDPWAWSWAWGTARSDADLGPGALDVQRRGQ